MKAQGLESAGQVEEAGIGRMRLCRGSLALRTQVEIRLAKKHESKATESRPPSTGNVEPLNSFHQQRDVTNLEMCAGQTPKWVRAGDVGRDVSAPCRLILCHFFKQIYS